MTANDRPDPPELPGHVNAHTHLYSGLAPLEMPPPQPPPANFVEILQRVWWRLDRALDPQLLRAGARFYVAHALLAGTTGLVDHHESPGCIEGSLDILADACQELGMRAVLAYGATERNGGRDEARRGLAECRRFVMAQRRGDRRPLVRGVVALHASFTVSDTSIREAGDLCRELDVPLHVHLAEAQADVDDARARGYAGPLERLLALHALPPGSILAHGVHLDAEAVRRAAEAGAWLVQNPRSNRGNAVGYPGALRHSSRVALGTDGYPSDMRAEADVLHDLAREQGESADAPQRRLDAGRALLAPFFGGDLDGDGVVTSDDRVQDVRVAGRGVVRAGRLISGDLEQIQAEARASAPRLWERMAAL